MGVKHPVGEVPASCGGIIHLYYKKRRNESMKNVTMETKGQNLVLTVDLSKSFGASSSGKTIIIGTTEGNQPIPGHPGVSVGLNVYKKK